MKNAILILYLVIMVVFISSIFYLDGKSKGERKNKKQNIIYDGLDKFIGVVKKRK